MAASHSHPTDRLDKAGLRAAMHARRAGADAAEAGAALAAWLPGRLPAGDVAGFWPLPGEIDLRALLHALHAAGRAVLLPETTPRGATLVFRRWHPGVVMLSGRFGTVHPDAAEGVPSVVLAPLLAFDRAGGRLGYGGGYYDRTLAALPAARRIGVAFACQEVPSVPMGPHDARLEAVATERGMIVCGA